MKRESTLKFICGRLLLVAAFILAYLMLALGNTAHATGEFKGLEISPASNRIELGNGEVYSGEMSVANSTDADMNVEMSVGSYSIEDSNYGSPNYDNPSKYSVMKDWIHLDKEEFTLAPGESTIVNYTITAPAEPPAGMQFATIFASTTPTEELEGSGIIATSRIGMVVSALMKDGQTIEQANIQDEKINGYQPTSPLKGSFAVKNEGNVGADITYQLVVKSAINGREVFKSETESSSVYPESTRNFSLSWDQVRIGFYNVEMNITLNGNNHTVKQLVCTVPVWIIILVVIAILSLVAYCVLNYHVSKESKKTKRSSKRK